MKNFLSEKIKKLPSSSTLAMLEQASILKEKGEKVIDLSLGEPDFKTPAHIKEDAKKAIDSDNFSNYPPVAGYKDLREKIALKLKNENNIDCSYENIVVSNGVKQCLTNVLDVIINPGDEVITFSPYWVSYAANIQLSGGVLIPALGEAQNSFEPTIDDIKSKISKNTKAILFSNPSNPTGHVLNKNFLKNLAELIEKNQNIIIISDEICEYIAFYEKVFSIGSIQNIKDRVITLNGVSKAYAMTGWRIGYSCSHIDIAKAITKLQGQTTSAPCGISQRAAFSAINSSQNCVKEMMVQYKDRANFLYDFFSKNTKLQPIKPLGAIYLFLSAKKYLNKKTPSGEIISSAKDICIYLLTEAKVATVSSESFGVNGYIRLSYAKSLEELEKAVTQIAAALKLIV